MPADALRIYSQPRLERPRMVLGLSGWMDGGGVSTGTVKYLISALGAARFAEILPEGFYIYNFPGSMEISALFRPHAVIEEGLITAYEPPSNVFHCDRASGLILFLGKEPNLGWEPFAECLFELAAATGVASVYFIGSYAGVVPHTRAPRLYSSVSDAALKDALQAHGLRFSSYQGPAGLSTYLTRLAGEKGLPMATIVAEIPAYVQGTNPRCIEAMTRRLAALLGLQINLDDLRALSDGFEAKVNEAIQARPELAEMVRKMEADYDSELFETQMGDLKHWLEEKGIRLD